MSGARPPRARRAHISSLYVTKSAAQIRADNAPPASFPRATPAELGADVCARDHDVDGLRVEGARGGQHRVVCAAAEDGIGAATGSGP